MTTTFRGQYHQRAPRSCLPLQPYVVVDHFISKPGALDQLPTRSSNLAVGICPHSATRALTNREGSKDAAAASVIWLQRYRSWHLWQHFPAADLTGWSYRRWQTDVSSNRLPRYFKVSTPWWFCVTNHLVCQVRRTCWKKNSIDQHHNTTYSHQSLARPAYVVLWWWSMLVFFSRGSSPSHKTTLKSKWQKHEDRGVYILMAIYEIWSPKSKQHNQHNRLEPIYKIKPETEKCKKKKKRKTGNTEQSNWQREREEGLKYTRRLIRDGWNLSGQSHGRKNKT